MEEILKEVLIKECGEGLHDKVFIVENLPREFIYEKTVKMVPRFDREGFSDGIMTADPKREMAWTLLPHLEKSQTGDDGICFYRSDREASERLMAIDRYIDRSLPRDARIPARINYGQQIGNPSSGTIQYSQIPRVNVPLVVANSTTLPPSISATETVTNGSVDKRRVMTPERLEKLRANVKKAQEARHKKPVGV